MGRNPIPFYLSNYFKLGEEYRIGAKKNDSLPAKIFNELATIFCKSPGKIPSPTFRNTLNAGLPSFMFTRLQMQYTKRESAKRVLKVTFYSNYLTCFSTGNDTQGSRELIHNFSFTYRQFDMVQISNDCTCGTQT